METVCLDAVINADGKVRLEVPSSLPPGPVKVRVETEPVQAAQPERKEVRWADFYGLGKEIWAGIDAQEYVNQLRDEWER